MKILVLLSRVPYPLEKGDKLRAFNQLKGLSKNHEIYLVALNDSPLHPEAEQILSSFCKSVKIISLSKWDIFQNLSKSIFSTLPFQVSYFFDKKADEIIKDYSREINPDVVFCQLIRMAEYAKNLPFPKVLDYMDVFSKGMKRRAKKSFLLKPFLIWEAGKLLKYENYVFDLFDQKTIISKPDQLQIPHSANNQITVIPNGVDFEYFQSKKSEKKYQILFTGNMAYPPNIDSAIFLAKKIIPQLKRQFPSIKLLIAGANPVASVIALKSKNIKVSGWVNDIRDCYNSSEIFVAPMQMGTGLQNKLLEAMAMKIPCITSELANKALGAKDNEEILVAKNVDEYVRKISELLQDQNKRNLLAENAYQFVKQNYNWDKINSQLEEILISAAKLKPQSHPNS